MSLPEAFSLERNEAEIKLDFHLSYSFRGQGRLSEKVQLRL